MDLKDFPIRSWSPQRKRIPNICAAECLCRHNLQWAKLSPEATFAPSGYRRLHFIFALTLPSRVKEVESVKKSGVELSQLLDILPGHKSPFSESIFGKKHWKTSNILPKTTKMFTIRPELPTFFYFFFACQFKMTRSQLGIYCLTMHRKPGLMLNK